MDIHVKDPIRFKFFTFYVPAQCHLYSTLSFLSYVLPRSKYQLLPQIENVLSLFSFILPQPPQQLSDRSLVTKYFLIHSQLGCTYDFLPGLDLNTALPLPAFPIPDHAYFPLPCLLSSYRILLGKATGQQYLGWSLWIAWRLIGIATPLTWLRAMGLKKGESIWSSCGHSVPYRHIITILN